MDAWRKAAETLRQQFLDAGASRGDLLHVMFELSGDPGWLEAVKRSPENPVHRVFNVPYEAGHRFDPFDVVSQVLGGEPYRGAHVPLAYASGRQHSRQEAIAKGKRELLSLTWRSDFFLGDAADHEKFKGLAGAAGRLLGDVPAALLPPHVQPVVRCPPGSDPILPGPDGSKFVFLNHGPVAAWMDVLHHLAGRVPGIAADRGTFWEQIVSCDPGEFARWVEHCAGDDHPFRQFATVPPWSFSRLNGSVFLLSALAIDAIAGGIDDEGRGSGNARDIFAPIRSVAPIIGVTDECLKGWLRDVGVPMLMGKDAPGGTGRGNALHVNLAEVEKCFPHTSEGDRARAEWPAHLATLTAQFANQSPIRQPVPKNRKSR